MRRITASPKRSDAFLKQQREYADLRLVLSAAFEDDALLTQPSVLDRYLTKKPYRIKSSVPPHDIAVRNIQTTEAFVVTVKGGADVRVGGGGIVLRCTNKSQPTIEYALKIARPSLFKGEPKWVKTNYRDTLEEIVKHAPLSHENVVRVVNWGQMAVKESPNTPDQVNLDVIQMEWIEGACPLNRYLADERIAYPTIVELLIQCFAAIGYVHRRKLIHWDIKSDNLLVSSSGRIKLTDIGNARRSDDASRGDRVYSTRGNPPEGKGSDRLRPAKRRRHKTDGSDTSRRVEYHIPSRSWDCEWLDLWMLARELNRLFRADEGLFDRDRHSLSSSEERESLDKCADRFLQKFAGDEATFALMFLRLMIRRLLHPLTPDEPRFYETGEDVVKDLSKLVPEFGAAQAVPELQAVPQRVLRIPQSGNVPWTARMAGLFNSAAVQRLRNHKQLGATSQVYPGANHARLEHVAGVMAAAAQYVRALYSDRTSPFWRLAADAFDIDALLLAALLHDVGHLAFGHYLEEMEPLFKGRSHVDYAMLLLDPAGADAIRFGPESRQGAQEDRHNITSVICEAWSLDRGKASELLAYAGRVLRPQDRHAASPATDTNVHDLELDLEASISVKLSIMHSIVESSIDADKLDYLLRDAHHCGVQYAQGIDVDRFFQALTAGCFESDHSDLRGSIAVTDKGILPVESILIARYQMFSCVYWHHTARALTAMLQFLVLAYLVRGSDSEVDSSLDELIYQFRRLSDERAVQWLGRELMRSKGLPPSTKQITRKMIQAILGNSRQLLYWAAYELAYVPEHNSTTAQIYERLTETAEKAAASQTPAQFVAFCRRVRTEFATEFCRLLRKQSCKDLCFEDGDILIDIPPTGKDQVANIFVTSKGRVQLIQEVSPIASAVKDAFQYWVRKPRVFLSPAAWQQCKSVDLQEDDIKVACMLALKSLVVPQLDLPLEKKSRGRTLSGKTQRSTLVR